MKKFIFRYSKKEKDWIYESEVKEPSISNIMFFTALGLKEILKNNGYDYTTLKITCEKIDKTE